MTAPRRNEVATVPAVAYLTYDATDSSVIKRAAMFHDTGYRVQGLMFSRKRVNLERPPDWDNLDLGTIGDRAFVRRLLHLCRAMVRIWRHRKQLTGTTLIYARNLDLAILGLFLRSILPGRPRLVYEVLDVHGSLLGNGAVNRVLRVVERRVLRSSVCLVVSSTRFIDDYFAAVQGYRGPHHLVENKLTARWMERAPTWQDPGARAPDRPDRPRPRPPWVLGWFGALRCPASLDLLTRLAAALPDRVVLYLRGAPVDLGWERFNAAIEGHPNIVFDGRYRNPEDLEAIYAEVDFNWCTDLVEPEANSKWLLPNRIYEGGYFNCPAIATADTATGDKIAALGLGATIAAPHFESLVAFFRDMTAERHQAMVAKVAALPRTEFCDDAQFRALLDRVGPA